MRVSVRLGEPYFRQAGVRQFDLELAAGATVAELMAAIEARFPALLEADVPPTVFIGDDVAPPDAPLADGSAATLVWAIAGG